MDALRNAVEIDQNMDWDAVRAAAAEGEAAIARGEYVELRSDRPLNAHLNFMLARVKADAERGPRK